ncbi:hypothetical protein MtrunA17_Chr3g0113711 [Medicago truncatula]|uniref:Transmembrane protein, putative n=1 Tax=Medicago truncatula TaxID=3880 RepID=G7JBT7_MEDTR|nr:uncharacterized protein LOC11406144 [Medicago truncatula]AES71177.1 transmembrane protein, putative [Medicago truncatula]RHN68420.1 hypothetical protein MtrunA17_Chr3g0113711 [Medicago truncatula]
MAISLNPIINFTSTKLETNYHDASRYSAGASFPKAAQITLVSITSGTRMFLKEKRFGHRFSVANSDQLSTDASNKDIGSTASSSANDQLTSTNPAQAESPTPEVSNVSVASPKSQPVTTRSSQKVRERIRAARVLNQSKEPKTAKSEMGSSVLAAFKESDRGKKRRRSGLPEAPGNLFDDSKRGMPKEGWTFDFPGGSDLFLIIFSFVFISTVMFGTTYIVWKVGAIHFND